MCVCVSVSLSRVVEGCTPKSIFPNKPCGFLVLVNLRNTCICNKLQMRPERLGSGGGWLYDMKAMGVIFGEYLQFSRVLRAWPSFFSYHVETFVTFSLLPPLPFPCVRPSLCGRCLLRARDHWLRFYSLGGVRELKTEGLDLASAASRPRCGVPLPR